MTSPSAARDQFLTKGWMVFAIEPCVLDWVNEANIAAVEAVRAPEQQHWLRCEGTWFVGVDALDNDAKGRVGRSDALGGAAMGMANGLYGTLPLHRAQVSAIYPGYPRPKDGEGEAAFAYRRNRDAAHVDGLLAAGPGQPRHLLERHAYIIGIPLNACGAGASPMTIWEGSHIIMRAAFERALQGVDQADWPEIDLTDIYKTARREVFETCPRHEVPALPGEAYLVHRMALHGVAPWQDGADAPDEGRIIAYFRPEFPTGCRAWLEAQ